MKTQILLTILLPSLVLAADPAKPGGVVSSSSLNAGAQRASPYTPDQLVAAYEKNAIKANAEFTGKVITISGVVDQIEADAIFFAPLKRYSITDIKCTFAPADAALFAKAKVGARMQITGTVGKMEYSNIVITGCKPVKP